MKLFLSAVGLGLLVLGLRNLTAGGPAWIAALDAVAAGMAFVAARSLRRTSDAAAVGLAAFLAVLLFIGGWASGWAGGPRWLSASHFVFATLTLLSLVAALAGANVAPARLRRRGE